MCDAKKCFEKREDTPPEDHSIHRHEITLGTHSIDLL